MDTQFIELTYQDVKPWCLEHHYAHRMPPVSYAYGILVDGSVEGVVTYGVPASSTLRAGICGPEKKNNILELNRLCINNSISIENAASRLISWSIKQLPRDSIIVSFADTDAGHIGYVYQATNWIYTGLSAKRTDWKIKGMEHLHGVTVADISRGQKNRAKYMREKYGDRFYLKDRPRKHRYVYFRDRRDIKLLRYPVMKYPKGDTRRYACEDTKV